MSTARRIVMVGAGRGGVGAALAARQQDPAAEILLITDELCEPYEKPPLSKAVLTGKAKPQDAPIAGPGGIGGHQIKLKPGARCAAIDRGGRTVVTVAGQRIPYDVLGLAARSIHLGVPVVAAGAA